MHKDDQRSVIRSAALQLLSEMDTLKTVTEEFNKKLTDPSPAQPGETLSDITMLLIQNTSSIIALSTVVLSHLNLEEMLDDKEEIRLQ